MPISPTATSCSIHLFVAQHRTRDTRSGVDPRQMLRVGSASSTELALPSGDAPSRIRKCDSTKRIPPCLRNASRVLDFLGPEKFCQMIDRLPDLPRDLLVARCTRLCMDRID